MPDCPSRQATDQVPDAAASGTSSGTPAGARGHGRDAGRHGRRIVLELAATVGVIAACAVLASAATWSNLNSTATNSSNVFTAGTVQIASNSSASAILSLTNAKPGASSTGCINVTYSGTLPANVKLYGTGGGTGLNQYLDLVVTRGTFTGTPQGGSCTGFTADSTNYIAQGAGVVYTGLLANLPTSSSAPLDPTTASPATWNAGSAHGYQFQVTVRNDPNGQGLTASATFIFEADNT